MSKNIYVIAEGQTEANFVNRVLSCYFVNRCFLTPITLVTKTDKAGGRIYKGGVTNFLKMQSTIEKTIKMAAKQDAYVTCMFDYYALPSDMPGIKKIEGLVNPYDKVKMLETELYIYEDYEKFVPYIQLHEFESIIFSDLKKLEEEYFEYDLYPLYQVLDYYGGNPELINNSSETAPSKRIIDCIPNYDKVNRGVSVAENIGMDTIMAHCNHFSNWINHIDKICSLF